MDTKQPRSLTDQLVELREDLRVMGIRITLAQAWLDLIHFAYDALLHYGVNYKDLPEYKNTDAVDAAQKMPISKGRDIILHWLSRAKSGINAAIRRKQLKVHHNEDKDTLH